MFYLPVLSIQIGHAGFCPQIVEAGTNSSPNDCCETFGGNKWKKERDDKKMVKLPQFFFRGDSLLIKKIYTSVNVIISLNEKFYIKYSIKDIFWLTQLHFECMTMGLLCSRFSGSLEELLYRWFSCSSLRCHLLRKYPGKCKLWLLYMIQNRK